MSFCISKLVVTGPAMEPAMLEFKPGFNMIDGPSNTGKSYVHQCLNFMTGGGDVPEKIEEAIGYTQAYLEIIDDGGEHHCFKRNLSGGDFEVAKTPYDNFHNVEHKVYKWKHNKDNENTISMYLLSLSGFTKTEIKQNKYNKKRTLSFRDIARLTIINEETIITKRSPLASSQKVTTDEFSVFSFLITGLDAKELIRREEPEVRRGKLSAQIDLIDTLLKPQSDEKIVPVTAIDSDKLLAELKDEIKGILSDITEDTERRQDLEIERKDLWDLLNKVESEQILEEEIFKRFSILNDQYEKDLNRLAFLNEGNELLSYLTTTNCPLCGRADEHSHVDLAEDSLDVITVTNAFKAEREKIELKKLGLAQTIISIKNAIDEKANLYLQLHQKITAIDTQLNNVLIPAISFQKDRLQQLINRQNEITITASSNKSFGLIEKREELVKQLNQKDSIDADGNLSSLLLHDFNLQISDLLTSWKYAVNPTVHFDESKRDIVINGKSRSSDGKGYRAITYSAFVIGLLNYCQSKTRPHPGIIILDSPMTAYKKKDFDPEKDEVPVDIENSFFENLCNISAGKQVIVLDNKTLTAEQKGKAHYQHFTGNNNTGRFGFFPSNNQS